MSSITNDASDRQKISKVSIAPISPETIVVKIRKFSTEVRPEDLPQVSSAFNSIVPRPTNVQKAQNLKVPMADNSKKKSNSSKTGKKQKQRTSRSVPVSTQENEIESKLESTIESITKDQNENMHGDSPPCLKHAAENISRKASDIPSEKISLCNNCSKSMLSYIFLVQDFLDSLAKEIVGDSNSQCLQCARQEVRNNVAALDERKESHSSKSKINLGSEHNRSTDSDYNKGIISEHNKGISSEHNRAGDVGKLRNSKRAQKSRRPPEEFKNYEHKTNISEDHGGQFSPQAEFVYKVSPPDDYGSENKNNRTRKVGQTYVNVPHSDQRDSQSVFHSDDSQQQSDVVSQTASPEQYNACSKSSNEQQGAATYSPERHESHTGQYDQNKTQDPTRSDYYAQNEDMHHIYEHSPKSNETRSFVNSSNQNDRSHQRVEHATKTVFHSPMERIQPNYNSTAATETGNNNDHNNNFPQQNSPTLYSDSLDGIISTLSQVEREIYDSARDRAGWEGLTETHGRLSSSSNVITSEAYVTSCRSNAEAIGCLVVGTSLLLCRTSRTLCVLVSDGVSTAFRAALSNVFQVVQNVRSLDSLGSTKLALLEQPELGITFEKLNVWRLTQFTKCIYLNPDTLVIQNCDELFTREELSAVPDIGWPDCFNSGVFVFAPSDNTFWELMEYAERQGSYDGGDQGLLNSYFNSWSSDISKKLSFIYNLMANVSYTYTPAFKQFGRNVKIVQFHGSFKPWHVKFFTKTGQVSPSSPVHPTYIQFVHIWLNIFRISVVRLMSQEIQHYAASHEIICAVEILRFFPLPSESEAEFFLTPPSVRVRLAEIKLAKPSVLPISEPLRRKSAEYSRYVSPDVDSTTEDTNTSEEIPKLADSETGETSKLVISESGEYSGDKTNDNSEERSTLDDVFEAGEVLAEKEVVKKKVRDKNAIPGSDIGDFQGMKAWEQGRIDYEGADSSDNVLKRLQFLMSKPK